MTLKQNTRTKEINRASAFFLAATAPLVPWCKDLMVIADENLQLLKENTGDM